MSYFIGSPLLLERELKSIAELNFIKGLSLGLGIGLIISLGILVWAFFYLIHVCK